MYTKAPFEPMETFRDVFEFQVDVLYRYLNKLNIDDPPKPYIKMKNIVVTKLYHEYYSGHWYESREDIEQQVTLVWWEFYQKERKLKKLNVYLDRKRNYIFICFYKLVDHYIKLIRSVDIQPYELGFTDEERIFTLDLEFIKNGCGLTSIDNLTEYERYIIYLYYNMNLGFRDIIPYIRKNTNSTWKEVFQVVNKLKGDY